MRKKVLKFQTQRREYGHGNGKFDEGDEAQQMMCSGTSFSQGKSDRSHKQCEGC